MRSLFQTFSTHPFFFLPLNLVRDQGVGGSNPLSPTNIFNDI